MAIGYDRATKDQRVNRAEIRYRHRACANSEQSERVPACCPEIVTPKMNGNTESSEDAQSVNQKPDYHNMT
jgi:hypothetical protein